MQLSEWITTEEPLCVWALLHSRKCIENKLLTRWCWILPCDCLICLACYYTVQYYRSWCIVSFSLMAFTLCSLHLTQFNGQATQPCGSFCTCSNCIGASKCCGPFSDFHGEPSCCERHMSWGHPNGDTQLQVEQLRSEKYLKVVSVFIVDPKNNELLSCFLSC